MCVFTSCGFVAMSALLGKAKGQARDRSAVKARYLIFGSRYSLFTQKVMAAFGWSLEPKEYSFLPKMRFEKSEQVEVRSGTHQIPVVKTPENWSVSFLIFFFRCRAACCRHTYHSFSCGHLIIPISHRMLTFCIF